MKANNKAIAAVVSAMICVTAIGMEHQVTSLSDHNAPDKALWVKPGDTIVLPSIGDGGYVVTNPHFLSLDGNVLTAIEPGIVGVYPSTTENKGADTLAIIVLPEAKGSGKVYICDKDDGQHKQWCSADAWKQVGAGAGVNYPRNPDDIAIIIMRGEPNWTVEFATTISENISLGQLYVGSYWDAQSYRFKLKAADSSSVKLTFASNIRDDIGIWCCANGGFVMQSWGPERQSLQLLVDSGVTLSVAGNGLVDLGYIHAEGDERNRRTAGVELTEGSVLDIAEGAILTVTNANPFAQGDANFAHIRLGGAISGSGTYRNANGGVTRLNCDATGFTGKIVESGGLHDTLDYRMGSLWSFAPSGFEESEFELSGYAARVGYQDYSDSLSTAFVRIGTTNGDGGPGVVAARLPMRKWTLNGGMMIFDGERRPGGAGTEPWTEGSVLSNCVDELDVCAGYTRIQANGVSADANPIYPTNLVRASSVVHSGKGTVILSDERVYRSDPGRRVRTEVGNAEEIMIGSGLSALESDSHSIVPWMASDQNFFGGGGKWVELGFATFDEKGLLVRCKRTGGAPGVCAEDANAYTSGAFSLGNSGTEVVKVNSLTVEWEWGGSFNCEIGEGRTLEITSGGLILSGGKADIGTKDQAGVGTLKFDQTAYVWANNYDDGSRNDGNISRIWSKVVAPYGFVNCMPGNLLLGGDQTGIDDEIVVNAGTLYLGALAGDIACKIDVPVRICGGASKIVITTVNGKTLAADQNLYFDDIGGFAGKIEIPDDSVETCMKCYVDGVTISRGTWGATGSGADNIDDEHFSGLGVLKVRKDELNRAMKIVVR